ncbi:MAG: sulfite exporter TauE/SafE family protein [Acidobacteria bacterium]|nr:sulfite exporter TauE/SafE family protein [Acidobacteriota bacterium]
MFGAAYLAGVMNALAGGGTLLTFPALIWIGLDPIVANITSTLALLPGALSSFFGYRKEISGGRQWLKWLLLPSLIGGLLGALLLLFTPAKFFAAIVPLLILFATLLFALQEPLNQRLRKIRQPVANHTEAFADDNANRWQPPMSAAPTPRDAEPQPLRAPHLDGKWLIGAVVVQFLVALYGGYFGAGIGILMLATLGLIGLTDIHQMNGLKNLLGFTINGIAALSFVFSGQVKWSAALVMAIASILGGYSGAHLARRFGRTFARRAVIVIGVLMTISLFFH